jgi:hypothetical protein
MTDPYVTLVFFAAVLLVFCACGAIAERYLDRKEREKRVSENLHRNVGRRA